MSPRSLGWFGFSVAVGLALTLLTAPIAGAVNHLVTPDFPGGGSYVVEPPIGGPDSGGESGGDPDDFANFCPDAPEPMLAGEAPSRDGAKVVTTGRIPSWYQWLIWLAVVR